MRMKLMSCALPHLTILSMKFFVGIYTTIPSTIILLTNSQMETICQ